MTHAILSLVFVSVPPVHCLLDPSISPLTGHPFKLLLHYEIYPSGQICPRGQIYPRGKYVHVNANTHQGKFTPGGKFAPSLEVG